MDTYFKSFLKNQDVSSFKKNGAALVKKYNDPDFDKLAQARRNVNDVKIEMQDNLNKLVNNNDDLVDLEEGAGQMRNNAERFKNDTKKMERQMYWRKIKMTVGIVLVVICIIIVIILLAKFL